MKALLHLLVAATLVLGLSACGNRGKLKSPQQIEVQNEKKARKAEKEQQEKDDNAADDEAVTPPPISPAQGEGAK